MRRLRAVLAASLLAAQCAAAVAADATPATLRHGYTDDRYGQLHYSIAQPEQRTTLPPIVLLHQSPNSSVEFDDLVRHLGRDRVTIAFDTPGHGGSDGPADVPTIEDYAAAIAEGLRHLGYGPRRPIDVFGYHTGSKIATELAITEPRMVRAVILSGIYDPPADKLAESRARLHHPASVSDLLERFAATLPRLGEYYGRQGLSDAQWGRIRIDSLRGLTRQEYGHAAAFEYAPRFAQRMQQVRQPVLLLPLDDGLAAPTRDAAVHFAQAQVEPQTFAAGAFFTEPARVAAALNRFSAGAAGRRRTE